MTIELKGIIVVRQNGKIRAVACSVQEGEAISIKEFSAMSDEEIHRVEWELVYSHLDEDDPPMTEQEEALYDAITSESERRGLEPVLWV